MLMAVSCGTISPETAEYQNCVSECEKAAMAAAAKYGGLATMPPCYDDIVRGGTTQDRGGGEYSMKAFCRIIIP